ncbi:hypothetical protein [Planosporangium flavigriseum]|uniref:hypothetical protein n=1 Tax=Planosporangium flavigriseum TaxID=373681 RepID=UPI00194EFE08|nr:hypothetical protein [Planosporangium flavigriseum]
MGEEQVESADEVQRLLVVLHPWRKERLRLLIVGAKRLPRIAEHERAWCFVDRVVQRPEELREVLGRRTYSTKTRGERTLAPVRPTGEGAYCIAKHDGHTHLAYELEIPREPGEPQRALNIEPEASYVVNVRNPRTPPPPGAGRPRREAPALPDELLARLGTRRFAPLDPPDFLDYPGTELVLIGAAEDASEDLGIDLNAQVESAARRSIFADLLSSRQEHPVEPLFAGVWR